MAFYNIKFWVNDQVVKEEDVFLFDLRAAKVSASSTAREYPNIIIDIYDINHRWLARKIQGKWMDIENNDTDI